MTKTQEYLEKKRIKALGLPIMYVVKSSPEGVDKAFERQVIEIKENVGVTRKANDNTHYHYDTYKLEEGFPYEIDIINGETSGKDHGYGTGIGDMWAWSYFCSLSKEEADKYYEKELIRVTNKYLKKEVVPTFDEQREKDIQTICNGILNMCVKSTGDYGMGGECPFCGIDCRWNDSLDCIKHEPDCIYLIAKDVSTGS